MADRAYLERLTKELADKGQVIESGWISLRLAAIPPDAPAPQLEEMHMAYMAGAQHLWASMMSVLDPGEEPTDADMRRMDLIAAELSAYGDKLLADLPTQGGRN
jgi:hypothetical protein